MAVLYAYDENGNVVLTNTNFIWGHLKINQVVDFDRLKAAINYCLRKNDNMRIKMLSENNQLFQYFEDYQEQDFKIVDVHTEKDVEDLKDEIINQPFEMFHSYLFVVTIYAYQLIDSIEINTMQYIKSIHLDSYLQSSVFMILFTIIVSVGVHFALKRVNLIESLKSVE